MFSKSECGAGVDSDGSGTRSHFPQLQISPCVAGAARGQFSALPALPLQEIGMREASQSTFERTPLAGLCCVLRRGVPALSLAWLILACAGSALAQDSGPGAVGPEGDSQINVNWFYGSYVPKEVPLEPLNADQRFKLYKWQTYTTWGIYIKTTLFTLRDWGDGFEGFAERYGTRESGFVIQNSVSSLGDGLLGWEPRYDRCRCTGVLPRIRHAIVRNYVTYDSTEKSLRPQLFTFLGAFTGAVTATAWEPGNPRWEVKGYQAAITQIPIGMGINLIGEFAPEIIGILHKHKE